MKDLPQTVFVVDDDDAVRDSLRLLLKSAGIPCEVYASAQDFLSGYDAGQPGCLVLDVRMPGMSGLEMQHELNLRGATLPVIFITGHGDIPMAVEAMQHGAFDFLQKPVSRPGAARPRAASPGPGHRRIARGLRHTIRIPRATRTLEPARSAKCSTSSRRARQTRWWPAISA
jgi:CheY-like chemotaxis protein